jgi:hypothetical protein
VAGKGGGKMLFAHAHPAPGIKGGDGMGSSRQIRIFGYTHLTRRHQSPGS